MVSTTQRVWFKLTRQGRLRGMKPKNGIFTSLETKRLRVRASQGPVSIPCNKGLEFLISWSWRGFGKAIW